MARKKGKARTSAQPGSLAAPDNAPIFAAAGASTSKDATALLAEAPNDFSSTIDLEQLSPRDRELWQTLRALDRDPNDPADGFGETVASLIQTLKDPSKRNRHGHLEPHADDGATSPQGYSVGPLPRAC